MTLLRQFDPFLQRYTPPSNSVYLSSASQNEMIECCSQEVTAIIVSEMRETKMYAIMTDEARDGKAEHTSHIPLCEVCFYGGYSEGEVPSTYRDDKF